MKNLHLIIAITAIIVTALGIGGTYYAIKQNNEASMTATSPVLSEGKSLQTESSMASSTTIESTSINTETTIQAKVQGTISDSSTPHTQAQTKIVSVPLKIISPNGGEELEKGKASTISFDAGNYKGKALRVFLINEETDESWEVAGNDSATAGTQSLYLIIPSAAQSGSKYKIGVSVCAIPPGDSGCSYRRGDYVDTSDTYFSIK